MTQEIIIDSFLKVRCLQNIAMQFSQSILIKDKNGSTADAKSILGLMSLDYSKPVEIFVDDGHADISNFVIKSLNDEPYLKNMFDKLNPSFKD